MEYLQRRLQPIHFHGCRLADTLSEKITHLKENFGAIVETALTTSPGGAGHFVLRILEPDDPESTHGPLPSYPELGIDRGEKKLPRYIRPTLEEPFLTMFM